MQSPRVPALLLSLALSACRTAAPEGPASAPARTRPTLPARALMDACWPEPGVPGQKVTLTFFKEGATLKDVFFEAEGAPNPVGRCLQQVAWLYPWEGALPETLAVTPPAQRPSGWTYLAYATLLAEGGFSPERGLLNPAPLVRACLAQGTGYRRNLRFYVEPQPVRVSVHDGERPGADRAVTDSERCVEAVLAATVYPGTRPLELSFPDSTGAPPAAPAREVAPYFGPPGPPQPEGQIDPSAAKERITERQPAVSACWEAALVRRPELSGARTLRIRIGPDGAVVFGQIVANRSDREEEAADYLLDACLARAVASLHFPPPGGGGAEFAYSWVFAHR